MSCFLRLNVFFRWKYIVSLQGLPNELKISSIASSRIVSNAVPLVLFLFLPTCMMCIMEFVFGSIVVIIVFTFFV